MKITGFADPECRAWDYEDTGLPTAIHFGNAVQVWAIAQDRDVTVQEAALAFNVTPALIEEAIEQHPWMLVGKGNVIEHDGE